MCVVWLRRRRGRGGEWSASSRDRSHERISSSRWHCNQQLVIHEGGGDRWLFLLPLDGESNRRRSLRSLGMIGLLKPVSACIQAHSATSPCYHLLPTPPPPLPLPLPPLLLKPLLLLHLPLLYPPPLPPTPMMAVKRAFAW